MNFDFRWKLVLCVIDIFNSFVRERQAPIVFKMPVIYMPTPIRDSYLLYRICDRYETIPSIKKMNSTHSLLMSLTAILKTGHPEI